MEKIDQITLFRKWITMTGLKHIYFPHEFPKVHIECGIFFCFLITKFYPTLSFGLGVENCWKMCLE